MTNQEQTAQILKQHLEDKPEFVFIMSQKNNATSCAGNFKNFGELLFMQWMFNQFVEAQLKPTSPFKEQRAPSVAP